MRHGVPRSHSEDFFELCPSSRRLPVKGQFFTQRVTSFPVIRFEANTLPELSNCFWAPVQFRKGFAAVIIAPMILRRQLAFPLIVLQGQLWLALKFMDFAQLKPT